MAVFTRFFSFLFPKSSDTALVFSIYEFRKPRDMGVFEIRLGKVIILSTDYDFKHSTFEEIKQKIDSKEVDLKALKFDHIKFNNIGQFGVEKITEWMKH